MQFGYHHATYAREEGGLWESVRERAALLEDAGFEVLTFMDHLWQLPHLGEQTDPVLDCYSALNATAAVTDSLTLGALVTCVHYRNPAYLARVLTSLDHVSGGRAVLGIGAGWFEDEYEAYGYDYPEPATRVTQMADAVRLAKRLWTEPSPVSYDGRHYEVEDAYLDPKPVQEPHPPVMIGGGGEQLTLRATAEEADWWNIPGADPEQYAHKLDVLREHCETADRPYDEIRKKVAKPVVIRDTTEAAHDAYEELMGQTEFGPNPRGERGAVGTAAEVADVVAEFADLGVDLYVLELPLNDRETLDRFVDDVAPQF